MLKVLIQHSPLLYFTQSLWRDEVFSIFVSERPVSAFIGKLTFEPPLYYILLHFWMKLFGNSEIAARSLSFLAFILATIVVIFYAEKRYKTHWLSWFLPVFFFLNPMLLYYAFEVRTYGWYIFFATASMVCYLEKKWRWYTFATVLGFYTHAYMAIVPFVQAVHYVFVEKKIWHVKSPRDIIVDPMIRALATIGLLMSPWLYLIAKESVRLKNSWYFPVDLHLIQSVLGNMFIGFEGTPWYLWPYTAYLSFILVSFFCLALVKKSERRVNLLFFCTIAVPLTVVIGISFIKPLFVNRYVIPVTIGEVFLLVAAIAVISRPWVQRLAAAVLLAFVIGVNIWYPSQHPKLPSRDTMAEVNALVRPGDVVMATSPLIFFEAQYYSHDRRKVFLYNTTGYAFPWYVGDFIVDPKTIVSVLPLYPTRAFLVRENGTFEIAYRVNNLSSRVSYK